MDERNSLYSLLTRLLMFTPKQITYGYPKSMMLEILI
ncbi:hypothetical protein FH603_5103 [Spirosoma sp. LMG 31447]|uniref:Uncharacterized protein n=1 Tax=Spirosoma utsteinense TaxID=2585773 RepID=A0ABR6WDH5_9BACT|nr:hypothetical protein [Spirosoma utsteinense]